MRITKTWLKKHGACKSAVTKFGKLFPNGAPLTVASAKRARHADLSLCYLYNVVDWGSKGQPACVDCEHMRSYSERFRLAVNALLVGLRRTMKKEQES